MPLSFFFSVGSTLGALTQAEKRERESALRAKKEKLLASRTAWSKDQKAKIVSEANAASDAARQDREDSMRKLREEREEQEREKLRIARETERMAREEEERARRKQAEIDRFKQNSPEDETALTGVAARIAAMNLA